jgi:sugar phosphate isomerase/epimerase
LGIVLDLGHLKVTSHWLSSDRYEFIDRVRDRVFAIHAHENNGRLDQHEGLDETSWCLEVIKRKAFADIPIVLECFGQTIGEIIPQVELMKRTIAG